MSDQVVINAVIGVVFGILGSLLGLWLQRRLK